MEALHLQTTSVAMQLSLRNRASTNLFLFFDCLGIHVLPKHFYTPVADYSWLRRNRQVWTRPWDMSGVHWDLDEQFSWLSATCSGYIAEVAGLKHYQRLRGHDLGYGYGPIESQVLHCFVRRLAPPRIIEVGSGVSTACMLDAVRRNTAEGRPGSEILCIEPYPKKHFSNIAAITRLETMVQTVDRSVFDRLDTGDLLFVDSSHALKTGSDVSVLYLEVLPKLRPGVHIHIHDINLPYLYVRETLSTIFGWQETALLAALLTGNSRLRVNAALSALHYGRQSQLQELLPDYRPQRSDCGLACTGDSPDLHFPSSLYLETR